ncbi:hypothetical protein [Fulvimarina manganoxydans]|uniref:hypothetical protein n=1 Tax=Fulvimarina manganoxydans TaxID=937218 RepID=UPI002353AE21|nr:hypothetical protein [Fulvimarina manganoxydans]
MVNAPKTETDLPVVPDGVVDAAIRQAGGDPREAVRGLILGQAEIEERLSKQISAGYVRRRP